MQIRWIVLFASMWVSWFDFGLQTTLGTFFIPLLHEFGEARSATACVQSAFIGINQGIGVFAGLLITRFGITKVTMTGSVLLPFGFFFCYFSTSLIHVIICISCLSAVGVSLMFVSSATMLSNVFPQRQLPIAIALHSASISLAGLTYPYLMNYILENFQLHGAYLILSGYLFNNLAIGVFFSYIMSNAVKTKTKRKLKDLSREEVMNVPKRDISTESEIKVANMDQHGTKVFTISNNVNSSETNSYSRGNITLEISATDNASCKTPKAFKTSPTNKHALLEQKLECSKIANSKSDILSVSYLTVLIATGIIISSQNGYLSLLIDIFKSKGYTQSQALNAFLPLNLCGLATRLLPGVLKNIHGSNLLILAICFTVCGSVGQVVIWLASNYVSMMIGVGLTGIPMGGVVSVASIVVAKLVRRQNFPVAFGLILTTVGVLASGCGPAYGAIRDSTESYSSVLIIVAAVQLVGSSLFFVAFCTSRERTYFLEVLLNHSALKVKLLSLYRRLRSSFSRSSRESVKPTITMWVVICFISLLLYFLDI